MNNIEWFEFVEEVVAVSEKIQDKYLRMEFALNMICEFCKRDPNLSMGEPHRMALFGLGYDHEEDHEEVEEVQP